MRDWVAASCHYVAEGRCAPRPIAAPMSMVRAAILSMALVPVPHRPRSGVALLYIAIKLTEGNVLGPLLATVIVGSRRR